MKQPREGIIEHNRNAMQQITEIFDGQELTIIEKEGEPHFLLKDVCGILEIGNPSQVKTRLEDEVISNEVIKDRLNRSQSATFVNEDGLYDVILDSRKPEAKRFRKWITSEVIPSIRKTGGYSAPMSGSELALLQAQNLVNLEKRVDQQEEKLDNITGILSLTSKDWRNEANRIINAIANKLGGGQYYQEIRKESYELLEQKASCDLNRRIENRRKKMVYQGQSKTAVSKINALDIIADDKKLISVYVTVIKELGVKYQLNPTEYQLIAGDSK